MHCLEWTLDCFLSLFGCKAPTPQSVQTQTHWLIPGHLWVWQHVMLYNYMCIWLSKLYWLTIPPPPLRPHQSDYIWQRKLGSHYKSQGTWNITRGHSYHGFLTIIWKQFQHIGTNTCCYFSVTEGDNRVENRKIYVWISATQRIIEFGCVDS